MLLKTVIYRIFRIILLFIVVYLVAGVSIAASVSLIDIVVATLYYYYFEVLWNKFKEPE